MRITLRYRSAKSIRVVLNSTSLPSFGKAQPSGRGLRSGSPEIFLQHHPHAAGVFHRSVQDALTVGGNVPPTV